MFASGETSAVGFTTAVLLRYLADLGGQEPQAGRGRAQGRRRPGEAVPLVQHRRLPPRPPPAPRPRRAGPDEARRDGRRQGAILGAYGRRPSRQNRLGEGVELLAQRLLLID